MSLKEFQLNQSTNNYHQQETILTKQTNQKMIEIMTKFNQEFKSNLSKYFFGLIYYRQISDFIFLNSIFYWRSLIPNFDSKFFINTKLFSWEIQLLLLIYQIVVCKPLFLIQFESTLFWLDVLSAY